MMSKDYRRNRPNRTYVDAKACVTNSSNNDVGLKSYLDFYNRLRLFTYAYLLKTTKSFRYHTH